MKDLSAYLINYGLFGLLLFAIGYACAVWRHRKRKPKAGELEAQLSSLEDQSSLMFKALLRLLQATNLLPPDKAKQRGKPKTEINPGRWDRFKAMFAKVLPGGKKKDVALMSRIQKLESAAKKVKNCLNYVSECFEKGIRDQNQSTGKAEPQIPKIAAKPEKQPPASKDDSDFSALFTGGQTNANDGHSEIEYLSEPYDRASVVPVVEEEPRSTSPSQMAPDVIEMYNRAVSQISVREDFRERYQPLRVGTVNAEERTKNPTIESEFRQTTDGDFFAMSVSGTDKYFLLPRLGLTIEAVSYGPGAVGDVFNKTTNYDPKHFYSRYSVLSPAIFRKLGERWDLLTPGELDLGEPD